MAEFASKGVAGSGLGLGIAGTALGLLNGNLGFMNRAMTYDQEYACHHDLHCVKELMEKDSEIARLNAKVYSDESDIAMYKYFDGELKTLREQINAKNTEQAVINATVNTGLATLNGQVQSIANTVNSITKTAIPTSAICNFGCGCSCANV